MLLIPSRYRLIHRYDRRDVLITPHCAGVSNKYPERFTDRFLEQYNRWHGGGELHDRVA